MCFYDLRECKNCSLREPRILPIARASNTEHCSSNDVTRQTSAENEREESHRLRANAREDGEHALFTIVELIMIVWVSSHLLAKSSHHDRSNFPPTKSIAITQPVYASCLL